MAVRRYLLFVTTAAFVGQSLQLSCAPCTKEVLAACKPLPVKDWWCRKPGKAACACCPECPKGLGETCNGFSVQCGETECGDPLYCTLYVEGKPREQRTTITWHLFGYRGTCEVRMPGLPLDLPYRGLHQRMQDYKQ